MQKHGAFKHSVCARCALQIWGRPRPFTSVADRGSSLKSLKSPESEKRWNDSKKGDHTDSRRRNFKLISIRDSGDRAQISVQHFKSIVLAELVSMRDLLQRNSYRSQLGINNGADLEAYCRWVDKTTEIAEQWADSSVSLKQARFSDWLQRRLWTSYVNEDRTGLGSQLRFIFQDSVANNKYNATEIMRQSKCADIRFPAEWYPKARKMDREIHLHLGPTNSGKTYHALQRLQKAKRGVYGGPLRLLAHEVHGRMIAAGRSCNMITGDERIVSDDPDCGLVSSTVEMMPIGIEYDVAVIDEIQMIAEHDRGSAWTEAFLGLRAKEVHLCGEARSLPLIRRLTVSTGDRLIVHEYERLSPLAVTDESLNGDLRNVRPGDCLVAFSRAEIHSYRNTIANLTGRNVAVVYGTLPPETRAEQARLFNDPESGYDVLVASNAIGMGLNLSIKRIIFSTKIKFNGFQFKDLLTTEVKQIGGRAGRYRVAFINDTIQPSPNPSTVDAYGDFNQDRAEGSDSLQEERAVSQGLVTTLRPGDLPFVRSKMEEEPEPITRAALSIPDDLIIRFASYFAPETPLTYILLRLRDIVQLSDTYTLADMEDELKMADGLAVVKNLSLKDRLVFCAAPATMDNHTLRQCVVAMASCVADSRPADFFTLPIPIECLNVMEPATTAILKSLEELHRCLTLYMWLSYRFVGIFTSQALAQYARGLTEQRISETLTRLAKAGLINNERRHKPRFLSSNLNDPSLEPNSAKVDE